jgi:hypothetical protein|tara:strand:+ start:128 stop:817 length:690 start_codon:yes stop_codon:yes gene_type:complete
MLKFKIDSENFSALNEVEQTFYAQSGEGYQLQVEGATDKSKLDEFRATNVDLLKQQEAFKGVDLAKYRELEEQERKLRDKELIDKKDFDGLISERTNSLKSDYEAKIQALTSQLNDSTGNYNTVVSKYEIEGAAVKAFTEHKISPDAYEAVLSQINTKFSVDNGRVIAKDGDNILTGANGNLTVSEFVASQPEIFKIQSNGGNGNGGNTSTQVDRGAAKREAYSKLLSR